MLPTPTTPQTNELLYLCWRVVDYCSFFLICFLIFTTRLSLNQRGHEIASKVAGHTIDAMANATAIRLRTQVLDRQKAQLINWVKTDANRPIYEKYDGVVDSVAFQGLQNDYLTMCTGYQGGLLIVYDRSGTGKSHALQAVA